jgi:hypothetical protein
VSPYRPHTKRIRKVLVNIFVIHIGPLQTRWCRETLQLGLTTTVREILLLACILLLNPSGLYLLHDDTRQYLKWDKLLSRAQGTCLSVETGGTWRRVFDRCFGRMLSTYTTIYVIFWSLFYVGLVYHININDEKLVSDKIRALYCCRAIV